jgi:carbon storage regulator
MLVLSRKKNESIIIGDTEVTIVEIIGNRVRLGITAPSDVPVLRREVREAIMRGGLSKLEEKLDANDPQD